MRYLLPGVRHGPCLRRTCHTSQATACYSWTLATKTLLYPSGWLYRLFCLLNDCIPDRVSHNTPTAVPTDERWKDICRSYTPTYKVAGSTDYVTYHSQSRGLFIALVQSCTKPSTCSHMTHCRSRTIPAA